MSDVTTPGQDRSDAEGRRLLNWSTQDPFGTSDASLFVPGENERVFGILGDASEFEPTGLEFQATVGHDLLKGDLNCDGASNGGDIELFYQCPGGGNCP